MPTHEICYPAQRTYYTLGREICGVVEVGQCFASGRDDLTLSTFTDAAAFVARLIADGRTFGLGEFNSFNLPYTPSAAELDALIE